MIITCVIILTEITLRSMGWWYLRSHHWVPPSHRMADRDVVLCLGESSTAGLWCDVKDSYPKQLERLLNEREGTKRYVAIVPVHVGQNTSQLAHRIQVHLEAYRPRLVILMCGVNNLWSLGESSVTQFLQGSWTQQWQLRSAVFLSDFRTCKLIRFLAQRLFHIGSSLYPDQYYRETLGYPAYNSAFPDPALLKAARLNRQAFVRAWRHDMQEIIGRAQQQGVPVLLMTYHIPGFPPVEEYVNLAHELKVPVVRNDLVFAQVMQGQDFRMADYFHHDHWHPKVKGYALIARNAFDVIMSARLVETHARHTPGRLVEAVERTGPND